MVMTVMMTEKKTLAKTVIEVKKIKFQISNPKYDEEHLFSKSHKLIFDHCTTSFKVAILLLAVEHKI